MFKGQGDEVEAAKDSEKKYPVKWEWKEKSGKDEWKCFKGGVIHRIVG